MFRDYDLERVLHPIGAEVFFRDHWEKKPLLVRRQNPDHYGGLLSLADVDLVIAFTRPCFADRESFQDGPARHSYVQGWLPNRQKETDGEYPGVAELHRVYEGGKTVIIMSMHHRWPAVAALCRNLEGFFHCPVHANLYLTPPGGQGFPPHFDTHEVFVLQLDGSKHWRVYGAVEDLPLVREEVGVSRDRLGPPQEIRLEAGDLLYLPRGHAHEAFTSECASLHLTVGIDIYRWVDLLHQALTQAAWRNPRLRASLPPGAFAENSSPSMAGQFRELLRHLADHADFEEALGRLGDQFFARLETLPDAHFVPRDTEEIHPDSLLEKREGMICRIVQDGSWTGIDFPGGRIGGPNKIGPALRFIAQNTRFSVRSLPGDLGEEAKLVLVRWLIQEGLLRTCPGKKNVSLLEGQGHGSSITTEKPGPGMEPNRDPCLAR